ncbi:MAG: chromosomal replication initiator protein DnaA [Clostridiales bacterium]|nr:chromosomal replication initiator protein DnaA [Clostridiales bacterium]MDO4351176.1 chromosomal replication initiator protein DnaA [Eubacteriales bacterium]MDY4009250.1 chromosomal replication initiator protein DnaA [Candidatus Limiplasma sp.]
MNAEELWGSACRILQEEMTRISYSTWIETALKPYALIGDIVLLECVSPVVQQMGTSRYMGQIQNAVSTAAGRALKVEVLCHEELQGRVNELEARSSGDSLALLNPKYTFDTFVVGSSNRFAHAVSLAVAEVPAKAYNPLFIYGGVGLGKTHLMHAIGHYAHELYPDMKILYITSEDFTNQLVTAMQTNQNQQFRERFRNVDILMVDDIQFIAGKHGTEEEFFHTFNHLREAGKQIVMTSDKPPKEIQKLEERLCSRFEGGLVADIQRPDFETRLAILRKKAEFEHLNIDDEILALIAEKIDTNIRELEGSLTRLTAYSSLTRRPIDMQLAREALRELFKHTETRLLTCDSIQEAVANYYGITVEDLKSPKRNHEITVPRQIAMYLAREMMGLSLTKIGDAFGGRHYTTVMSSIDKVEESIKQSPSLASLLDDIRRMIKDNK